MTRTRKTQIDLNTTPYYYCIARCVRRTFLYGEDKLSDQNHGHLRDWIVKKNKLWISH
ncbi:hypothetical protein [Aliikangiella maris]|uniref:Transposase n=2 Tax=Aliikangiella maris TaxID=3162458 RepID=A0ABV3MLA3_9GAMM